MCVVAHLRVVFQTMYIAFHFTSYYAFEQLRFDDKTCVKLDNF